MKRVLVIQVCEECGDEHIKHMYCPNCKRVTAHKQRREYEG